MKKLLESIGYTDNLELKDKVVYVIVAISFCIATTFLFFYAFLIKYYVALPGISLYLLSCITSLFLLKYKKYNAAKILILLSFIIQDSSVVFFFFPHSTDFNLYYFIIVPITFFVYDFDIKSERKIIIGFNILALILLILSELVPESANVVVLSTNIIILFKVISIFTCNLSIIIVFYVYSKHLTKLHNELKKLANTDSLTNIYNRRVLFKHGEELIDLNNRYNRSFTLILFDIDFFKNINDQYGHPVGDSILVQLTELVTMNIRREDIFSRYGGEEFALIIKNTHDEDNLSIANKLLKIISSYPFKVSDNKTVQITVSAGVTAYNETYTSFGQMLQIVDNALYEAKENGRNQTVWKTI